MVLHDSINFREILNAMEDGIYITSEDYTVEFMNKTMIQHFGEGVGKKCYEVVNGSEVMCPWCRAQEVFTKGEGTHSEIYMPYKDRTYRIIEVPITKQDGSMLKLNIYRDITKRRTQELKLQATEASYRRLFEHVGVGVYISTIEGRFINANRALLDMLGYDSKSEFLELDIQEDLYARPKDRVTFQNMMLIDGRVINYPVAFKHRDGSPVPMLLTATVYRDHVHKIAGYEGIVIDQTQILSMEKELKEAHDFLNNVIHSSPNAIIGATMQGIIVTWNQGAEETLGYSADMVIGKMDVRELYKGNKAYEVMKNLRGPDFGGPGKLRSYPMTFIDRRGIEVEGNLSASLIYDATGKEFASVGFFVDLGEQLDMERKLHRTQEQLLQSEKLAAMGRLTSQLAHELNNPLYGIMNTLELMKTEIPPTNKRRKLLEMALSECERLADMLRKTLSFSKPDQEQRCTVDINTILDEILLLHEKQLREIDIKLHTELTEGLKPVLASKNQLRQVFLNLISNAKDAMPEGGELSISTDGNGKQIQVQVTDTGVGIKPENMDKIFETFFTTKTDTVKGVGLGLSVCYGFIKDHGGDIKVESQPGKGTTFSVILPTEDHSPVECPVEKA